MERRKPTVTIIDYGMGNILSVTRAFEHCGATVYLARTAREVAEAHHLVIPGVGAFGDGMAALGQLGLVPSIVSHHKKQLPLLGICLGMQMMLESSDEFGVHQGLGLIAGTVNAIPKVSPQTGPHKVPHLGWVPLKQNGRGWSGTALENTNPGESVYFMHSFMATPESTGTSCLALADYNGIAIGAAVQAGETIGCQFHPEKSGPVGLAILSMFLKRGQAA
ncbi:MAG: imidazole glycerol phosphate synthase subunit HisH [Deltaproteobacteria bacterium]|nr:imidazole glycerol phosphate synthase subunit HisH [Deltaproteobacteria bacterium]MBI3295907.1 imidazole glycerol phosphate synthase subunit HisH [Deltaproteobacteria bacterium]